MPAGRTVRVRQPSEIAFAAPSEVDMPSSWFRLFLAALASALLAQAVAAEDGVRGRLVSAQWLQANLNAPDLLLLDASFTPMYAAKHIPGAIGADLFAFGAQDPPPAVMEQRLQSWGIGPGKRVVLYDQGGDMMATRLFFELYYRGVPVESLYVLDGGLARWQETGGAVTKEPTPPPAKGSFRIGAPMEGAWIRLPAFLAATGDPAANAIVEALEPSYHFGATKFFDRAGHVPNAIMWPRADFYNADKTFKSAEEIARMAAHLGIRPEQQVDTYCGGGVAASVPWFALKFIAGYPRVSLYVGSQLEWLQDKRGLPMWTYDAPALQRDRNWVNAWTGKMMRTYGITRQSVIDVRPAQAYAQGHVPYALNVPAEVFANHLDAPEKLADVLGRAGVDPSFEAVIVSDGGVNPRSALAFLMLERLGQKHVSMLMDSVDEWGLGGLPLTNEPTAVGPKKSPFDLSIPPRPYRAEVRPGVLIRDPAASHGHFDKVFVASGATVPAGLATKAAGAPVIHLPYSALLNADGSPKAAKDIWSVLDKAGVPRFAEIVTVADDPGEAAASYFILKLMGWPDVKVMID
jgi:thiosulfate/3-mercaptopyruvate sulfurtransferase